MRSYKSIERPAQVLGMDLSDLGVVIGVFFGSVILIGIIGMKIHIPRLVYLGVLIGEIGLIVALRQLSSKQAPGFLVAWISFHFTQPRRLAVGPLPPPPAHDKGQNHRV